VRATASAFDFGDAGPEQRHQMQVAVAKFRGELPSARDIERLQATSPGLFNSGYFVLAAVAGSKPGAWQALRTKEGWRAVRLDASVPAKPASYEALRGVLLHDWTDATASEQRSAAVHALARKYRIKYETRTETEH